MSITIETDISGNAKRLAAFLKTIGYVKSVKFNSDDQPLTASDWVKPGRTATEEEVEALCRQMEEPQAEYTIEEALAKTVIEIKEWRKKKSKNS